MAHEASGGCGGRFCIVVLRCLWLLCMGVGASAKPMHVCQIPRHFAAPSGGRRLPTGWALSGEKAVNTVGVCGLRMGLVGQLSGAPS